MVLPSVTDAVRDLSPKGWSLTLIGVSFVLVVLFAGVGSVKWSMKCVDNLFIVCGVYYLFFFPRMFRFKVLFVFPYFHLGLLMGYLV